jgi:SAM-dependent methyltransferase
MSWDDAHGYERFMGKWSRVAGRIFLDWLALPKGLKWLDVGCGTGAFASEFQRRGLVVTACEASPRGRAWAERAGVTVHPFDVALPVTGPLPGGPFDLAFSLEVAEHIPSALAGRFVDHVVANSELVVLTAAHPGQGGQGHVNEQPQSYWIEKLGERGYAHDEDASKRISERLRARDTDSYLYENLMVFRRANA